MIPEQHRAEVVRWVEKLVDHARGDVQSIFDGLADRPKPGDKQRAREAAARILQQNGELWRLMEGKKPLVFAPR